MKSLQKVDAIAQLERIRDELAGMSRIEDVTDVMNRAEALLVYSQRARLSLDMQNICAEARLRAERRAGELLRDQEKHPPGPAPRDRSHRATDLPKLEDLGINKG